MRKDFPLFFIIALSVKITLSQCQIDQCASCSTNGSIYCDSCNPSYYLWEKACFPCGADCLSCVDAYGHQDCRDSPEDSDCYDHGFIPPNYNSFELGLGLGLGIPFLVITTLFIYPSCK